MLKKLFARLMGHPPNPVPAEVVTHPVTVSAPPANDPLPLVNTRPALRHIRNNMVVLGGSVVITANNVQMRIASGEQKPPYVICIYRGRRIAVRPDTIACYWAVAAETIQ